MFSSCGPMWRMSLTTFGALQRVAPFAGSLHVVSSLSLTFYGQCRMNAHRMHLKRLEIKRGTWKLNLCRCCVSTPPGRLQVGEFRNASTIELKNNPLRNGTGHPWQRLPSLNFLFTFHEWFVSFFFGKTFRLEAKLFFMRTSCINDNILWGFYMRRSRQAKGWKNVSGRTEIRVASLCDMGAVDMMTKLHPIRSIISMKLCLSNGEAKVVRQSLVALITSWLNLDAFVFADTWILCKTWKLPSYLDLSINVRNCFDCTILHWNVLKSFLETSGVKNDCSNAKLSTSSFCASTLKLLC